MYDKMNPLQRNGLMYGFKLRMIGGIEGILGHQRIHDTPEVFTQVEFDQIKGICNNAKRRAKETFETIRHEVDTKAETSSGSEAEHRQYNGK